MKTFVQLLRIGFWMLPLQRALTIVGALVLLGGQLFRLPFNMPGSTLPITFFGATLMMAVPLLAGGVFFRMLSASRALLLRPHARGRLLAAAMGLVVLVTCVWIVCYWMAFLPVPAKYQPGLESYILMFATTLSFGTQCAIALFIASRSPAWTLLILVAWQLPGLLLRAFGVEDASRLLGGPVSLAMSLVAWTAFAVWYLRARRVHASGWGRKENSSTSMEAESVVTLPATREQAMSRWLLGGTTPLHLGVQCLLAAVVVLAIQWMLARDSDVHALHAMMFGALSATAVVSGAVSRAMASHARGLWLPAGRTRLALHAWIERQMLRVVLAISVAVALPCALVWWLVLPRPELSAVYVLCAVLAPGLAAAWLGLMQQHRRGVFDAVAGLVIFAGWFYGLVRPLYVDAAAPRWDVLAALLGFTILLREVAYVRWRSADWRRTQRA
ncbi:MAG: hypothetical protein WDO12_10835 [Pseudomonadota bacterium]